MNWNLGFWQYYQHETHPFQHSIPLTPYFDKLSTGSQEGSLLTHIKNINFPFRLVSKCQENSNHPTNLKANCHEFPWSSDHRKAMETVEGFIPPWKS